MRYHLCHVDEVPAGTKKAFSIKNIPIVVTHSDRDEFFAIYGLCPHQRASLSDGALGGLTVADEAGEDFRYERVGEILRCPWHGFSFDVTTGVCLAAPERLRVKTYPLVIEHSEVFLDL
ncbi:MAG TPA: Rieske 2Fe-2S domain-containing protein [Ktedonobacteraceae bacterium]|nr:Rieske 2Fe-2S domain-containing protein [Ktedonobacteraceae bacterium]